MKIILMAQEIGSVLLQKNSFLNRTDVSVFTADSTDEALMIHRTQHADLFITHPDMSGMAIETFSSRISDDLKSRRTLMIMVCPNNAASIEQCTRCGAHAIVLRPVNPPLLLAKAQQFLDLSPRETYRVLLSAAVEGKSESDTFFCRSRDISPSGMSIETEKTLIPGGRVNFALMLPDGTRLQAAGEVVRILQQATVAGVGCYGIKFSTLPAETRRVLDGFIDSKVRETRAHAA